MTDQDYQEADDEVVTDGGCPAETASQSQFILEDDRRTATFSDDREYRYRLSRTWDASKPACAFVMLNPSTADASDLDPTCRRCKSYAEDWGFGSLIVGNIFALRATDPDELYTHEDPVGPRNDEFLREIVSEADLVVAAWGTYGETQDRGREVARTLNVNWHCLDTTQGGQPNHPLYQEADLKPKPWDASQLFVSTDGGVDLEQQRGELVADGGTQEGEVDRGDGPRTDGGTREGDIEQAYVRALPGLSDEVRSWDWPEYRALLDEVAASSAAAVARVSNHFDSHVDPEVGRQGGRSR